MTKNKLDNWIDEHHVLLAKVALFGGIINVLEGRALWAAVEGFFVGYFLWKCGAE